jgi:hypothetical protein
MSKTFTESLHDLLAPMVYTESADLTVYLNGLGLIWEEIDTWVSDTNIGTTPASGYSLWIDVNRCPDEALPWLAQFVGIQFNAGQGLTADEQRALMVGLGTWHRGTVAALKAAPLPYLTGAKQVIVKERDTGPYHFEVITQGSETPDQSLVLAALLAQKPAGLVMTYVVNIGQKPFTIRDSTLRNTTHDSLRFAI